MEKKTGGIDTTVNSGSPGEERKMWKGRGRSERALAFFPFCDSARKQRGQTNQRGFLTSVGRGGPLSRDLLANVALKVFTPLTRIKYYYYKSTRQSLIKCLELMLIFIKIRK